MIISQFQKIIAAFIEVPQKFTTKKKLLLANQVAESALKTTSKYSEALCYRPLALGRPSLGSNLAFFSQLSVKVNQSKHARAQSKSIEQKINAQKCYKKNMNVPLVYIINKLCIFCYVQHSITVIFCVFLIVIISIFINSNHNQMYSFNHSRQIQTDFQIREFYKIYTMCPLSTYCRLEIKTRQRAGHKPYEIQEGSAIERML